MARDHEDTLEIWRDFFRKQEKIILREIKEYNEECINNKKKMELSKKPNKLKKSDKFWIGIGIVALLIGNFIFYKAYTHEDKQYCGEVIKKPNEEVTIKHGTKTELYLVINFDEIGTKTLNVNKDTYFTNEKGDRVCFTLSDREINPSTDISILSQILGILFFGYLICCGLADLLLVICAVGELVIWFNKKLNR